VSVPAYDESAPPFRLTLDLGAGPVAVTARVPTMRPYTRPTPDRGTLTGLDACLEVETADGRRARYFLSRLPGERRWYVDALYPDDGAPGPTNGFGSRPATLHVLPDALEDLLNRFAERQGLAARIGPDVPLVLPD
jgi:hypothetical protein